MSFLVLLLLLCQVQAEKVCHRPLGIESDAIKDWQITKSFYRNHWLKFRHWSLRWLQVDLHDKNTWVTGIATQRKKGAKRWVRRYNLLYSDNGFRFHFYKEKRQVHAKVFAGNTGRKNFVRHELKTPIRAKIFRIHPLNFIRTIEMWMELYGCKDGCLYKPCKNGGTCVPDYIKGSYTCNCPDEFYGDTCRVGNLCKLGKPCLNGGNCSAVRYWPYFKCTCPSTYTGFNCGLEIGDPCNQSYCLNNGTCQRIESWPYSQCICSSGYAGFNCGTHIGLTSLSHPCLNGGTCLGDEPTNLLCSCPKGFYGYYCEYKQDDACSSDPCLYNGTCIPDNNLLGFKCNCRSGYIGFNCGIHKGNPCSDKDNRVHCKNGGKCTQQDNALGYTCECTPKYIGFDCSFLKDDPCLPNPCQNNGRCARDDGLKDFICNCSFGYTGNECENPIVHGIWSHWMPWTHCNKPCNNGTRTRMRTCDNPSPAFGGNNCEGLPTETEPCNQNKCPAESINYQVKLRSEGWEDSLENSSSKHYENLVDKIKNAVNGLYSGRDEVEVVILEFW